MPATATGMRTSSKTIVAGMIATEGLIRLSRGCVIASFHHGLDVNLVSEPRAIKMMVAEKTRKSCDVCDIARSI